MFDDLITYRAPPPNCAGMCGGEHEQHQRHDADRMNLFQMADAGGQPPFVAPTVTG